MHSTATDAAEMHKYFLAMALRRGKSPFLLFQNAIGLSISASVGAVFKYSETSVRNGSVVASRIKSGSAGFADAHFFIWRNEIRLAVAQS